ncbi:hypothetical protein [Fulvivirga sediminis]|nr:hypothetical protein [Fulvivirga sediminis]
MFIILTACLIQLGCDSKCLNQVNDFSQFKNSSKKFNDVIAEYSNTHKLVLYVDSDGCIYLNDEIYNSGLKSTIYSYLSNAEGTSYEVVLFADPLIFNEKFGVISDIYTKLREAYMNVWRDIAYQKFKTRDFSKLSYDEKGYLWSNFPPKNLIRFDYLTEAQAEAVKDNVVTKIPPVNLLLEEEKGNGLKPR